MSRTTPFKATERPDVSIQLQLPNEWNPTLAERNVGVTAAVEADRCNPEWVAACNRMTTVIVPSKHAEMALRASGKITVPLHVVPEAFSDEVARDVSPIKLDVEAPFNFLVFGQLTGTNPFNDRKNIFFTVKWLTEAFAHDDGVGIVLKTNSARNSLIDQDIVLSTLRQLVREVRAPGQSGPQVTLLHGDMMETEVAGLYRHTSIGALVALTRGEGFGLPILEAAASGLPIIATGWSAHTEYLANDYSQVQYKLVDVHQTRIDGRIFVNGARWAEPNEQDFKRRAIELRRDPARSIERAAALRARVMLSHSRVAIERAYDALAAEIF
jgi:glycosyltransferase involved in cell wall biosynthesis